MGNYLYVFILSGTYAFGVNLKMYYYLITISTKMNSNNQNNKAF